MVYIRGDCRQFSNRYRAGDACQANAEEVELMSQPRARVRRGDETVEMAYKDVAVGDEVVLQAGDEVPADGVVLDSRGLELNKSMLTLRIGRASCRERV